ncbi:hypothetical protein EHE19_007390 [Ruminiclostridium herbifermentans]|uniref:Uncharacterized protein n=1 Tax=Ruminiclostridium herbifermentans TaxID=2488810 RepID=A0A4U7JK06_9FIRM|nr:hypothetical protein [Ruminiclostridium herbifermentans]QNU68234.1 hypothetical protein EHE19_007390 [Ruminiclostridium herbifermentans]
MSYKRLIPMVLSLFILLFPLYFFLIKISSKDFSYILPFILLVTYFLYCFNFIRKEFIKIKADRQTGILEKTLVLCDYNVLYTRNEKYGAMPPIPTATFLSYDNDEYIHLSGDFSKVDMHPGKKYRVKFYKESGLLIDIEYNKSKSKKLKLNVKSKNQLKNKYYNFAFKHIDTEHSNKTSNRYISFLQVLIFTIIGALIFGVLYIIYLVFNFIQAKILMSEGYIMLIQPDFVGWLFIIFGFTIFILITFEGYDDYWGFITKVYNKLGFKRSLIIISTVFFMLLSQLFNICTIISDDGIELKKGYFMQSKTYGWSSVNKASVYYSSLKTRSTTNKLKLHYVLQLSDGNSIDLKKSKMFWNSILKVDNILKQKHIYIDKGILSFKNSTILLSNENIDFDSGARILSEIMVYQAPSYLSNSDYSEN